MRLSGRTAAALKAKAKRATNTAGSRGSAGVVAGDGGGQEAEGIGREKTLRIALETATKLGTKRSAICLPVLTTKMPFFCSFETYFKVSPFHLLITLPLCQFLRPQAHGIHDCK